MRIPVPGLPARIAVAVVVLAVLTGCTQVVPGVPAAARSGGGPTAAVAAPEPADPGDETTSVTDVLQEFWRDAFPAAFDQEWRDITTFAAVDTRDPAAPPPPCVEQAADVAGQAFYCPAADAVVWDAGGLIPDLESRFGRAGVTVVLAHEIGHAVQSRLGIDDAQAADPVRYPTILLEAMADCYAGVALAHLARGPGLGPEERDDALLALVGFRDPLGLTAGDDAAHGNAFDRVSAFQDGYRDGATRCAGMTLGNRAFTQRRFGSADDLARRGDLPLTRLLAAVETDARAWFTTIGSARAPGWSAPPLVGATAGDCGDAQGPVRYCADGAGAGSVVVDRARLGTVHRDVGDYASATLVAARYGLATVVATGGDPDGPAAGRNAVCLAGAYTSRLLDPDGTFSLSPGDLDEAVQVLLTGDQAARDARGQADPTAYGFDRVARFREGVLAGPDRCLSGG